MTQNLENPSLNFNPSPPPMADREPFVIPEGWELVSKLNKKGMIVKYYTNVLGQKFYSEEDLMRNIKDAKERGLSIYAPDFDASSLGASGSRQRKKSKLRESSKRICKNEKQSSKHNEVEKEARTGLHLSNQTAGTTKCRTSRRIAGLEPELKSDFALNKALEYVIKEKSR